MVDFTTEELIAQLATLKAENAKLTAASVKSAAGARALNLKVGAKGGLCVYGLGRFPVSLYKGQWLRLLAIAEQIKTFIEEHPELTEKAPLGADDAVE